MPASRPSVGVAMVGSSPHRIGKSDAQHHIVVIQRVLGASDDAERDAALVEGFARFGMGLLASLGYLAEMEGENKARFAELIEQSQDTLLRWVRGDRMTTRADEDERRIAVAEEMLARAPDDGNAAGWLVRALLTLPEGHPQRDTERAEALARRRLATARGGGDAVSFLLAAIDLLDYELAAEAEAGPLYAEARQRLPVEGEPQLPRQLDVASLHFHVMRAIGARDGEEPERFAAQLALARARAGAIGSEASTDRRQRQSRMLYAMLVDMDETDPAGAAAAWAAVNSGAEEPDDLDLIVRYHEGRVRLSLGEHETAARLFAPLLAPARSDYLGAIRDAEVEDRGEYFSKLSAHHAYALGALGRWDESLRALDGARSLRLRQRAGLRASRRGRTLLGLERELYAGERGVPLDPAAPRAGRAEGGDRMHGQVSRQARMFERYRRLRPELDAAVLESPGIAALAAVLGEGEAVLSLGNNFTGTVAVLVCHGDRDQPSRAAVFPEWTNEHWIGLIGGDETAPGWLFALGAPELGLDHADVLDRLLEGVDAGLGRWIAGAVRELGVRRLTVVAHRFLHLLPFWALPSLAAIEVASAPSLAHLIAARAPRRRASPRRAVIVENPSGDLPLAAAETAAVQGALAGAGFATETFAQQRAVESLVGPALGEGGVLHFGGHGRSDTARERASALLMHADPGALGLPAVDPLGALAAQVGEWEEDEAGERFADAGTLGRLQERRREDGSVSERSLDYSATGTLWTAYGRDGAALRSAELWSAGDIAVGAQLGRLGIAFLSACEAGSGGFEPMIDEYGGLPAALLLAGAGTVVCSLWPVPESLTLLAADLFYRHLAAADERFDVVGAVRACGRELRELPRDAARERLLALRGRTADPAARFMLEAAAWRLRDGPEHPYARPVHWAAFFAVGAPQVRFAKARRGRA